MRFIQDPETLELVPAEDYRPKAAALHYVMPDIQPYRSQIDGSLIGSRSTHRAHLKAHGCIEVGNETQTAKAWSPAPGLKQDILKAMGG